MLQTNKSNLVKFITLTFSLRGSREFPSAGRLTRNWTLKIRRSSVVSDCMLKSERSKDCEEKNSIASYVIGY